MVLRLLSAERDAVAQHNFFGAIAFCTLLCRRCYKGIWAVTLSFAVPTEGMQFRLKTSKTDPYGKGMTIEVGLCKPPLCATTAIRTYLTMTDGAPHDPLFRYKDGRPLSKKTFVDEVRRLLESAPIGNASSYSGPLVSNRRGNLGGDGRCPRLADPSAMGRWKSDSVLRYIRHDSSAMKGLAKLLTSSSND